MNKRERFAGFLPGMMLVLGADIPAEQVDKQLKKQLKNSRRQIDDFFLNHVIGKDRLPQFYEWVRELGITFVTSLGAGSYGIAFEVRVRGYPKEMVVKLSDHGEEYECVQWIEKNQGISEHLPKILSLGGGPTLFYYLRPKYKKLPPAEYKSWKAPTGQIDSKDERKFVMDLFKETGGEFFAYDAHEDNIGVDDKGNLVYYDPACGLGGFSHRLFGEWVEARLHYVSMDELRKELEELGGDPKWLEEWTDPVAIKRVERDREFRKQFWGK